MTSFKTFMTSILLISIWISGFIPPTAAFTSRSLSSRLALRRTPTSRILSDFVPVGSSAKAKGSPTEDDDGDIDSTPSRPLARLIQNFRFVTTNPLFNSRKRRRKRRKDSEFVVSLSLRDGMVALMAYLGVGILAYHYTFEKWSMIDALYFTCVCFSTVGYGDICPQTRGGKIFTCIFGFTGIALLGAAVATIGSKLVQAEAKAAELARRESQKRLIQIYDKMPKVVANRRSVGKEDEKKVTLESKDGLESLPVPRVRSFMVRIWKATRWILQSLSVAALGGIIIGRLEGWSWFNSIYYSMITASTIGLGDFAPSTPASRLAAVFFIPMSVAAAGEILASVGSALVEQRQKKIFQGQLENSLTVDHLKVMDANEDGKVDREEYVLFMLMEMGLVTKQEIEELQEQFGRLDVTRSGYLDQQDLLLMAKLRGSNATE